MKDLELARGLAEKFHAGQMYGRHPYMYHLEMVSSALKDDGDERLAIIGMLHDMLEDTACKVELLEALFEDNIVEAVLAITHKKSWQSREEYLTEVKANPLAKKVKLVDLMMNMRESILRGDMKRVKKYAEQIALLAK
jgi:(p)ppGpp synthase/HD superfamily hydrolase